MTREYQKSTQLIGISPDAEGYDQFSVVDPISADYYWHESVGVETVGDGNADGTTVVTLSIPAGKRFICTSLMASSNAAAVVRVGYGTLGSMTDQYVIDIASAGGVHIISDKMPIFSYYNSTAAAVTVLMYVPQTAKGVATNNDANHYFDGYIGGLLYGGVER